MRWSVFEGFRFNRFALGVSPIKSLGLYPSNIAMCRYYKKSPTLPPSNFQDETHPPSEHCVKPFYCLGTWPFPLPRRKTFLLPMHMTTSSAESRCIEGEFDDFGGCILNPFSKVEYWGRNFSSHNIEKSFRCLLPILKSMGRFKDVV